MKDQICSEFFYKAFGNTDELRQKDVVRIKRVLAARPEWEIEFFGAAVKHLAEEACDRHKLYRGERTTQAERDAAYARRHKIKISEVAERRYNISRLKAKSYMATSRAKGEKVKAFDRMVEALDAVSVNGKLLGDCTGGDLLRAAVQLEESSRHATAQSQFYRQLAAIVGKTNTVREAGNRAGVVGILTHHFKETA